jgi:putative tryptophan/tyrosine transport system substrate-binding protein
VKEAKVASEKLNMKLEFVEARAPEELDRAFATIARERIDAVLLLADPLFVDNAKRIGDLAIRYRLPAVIAPGQFAEAGFVATYGPDFSQAYTRAAAHVAKILKGAKPAEMPVEQMTNFELVINAKSAKALGITIPPALAARANHVIE